MTAQSGDRTPHTPTVEGLRAAAAPVLAWLAETAWEREQKHDFAHAKVRELIDTGILLLAVPASDGGAGGSQRDLFDFVIDLGRADSSAAQALRGNFLASCRLTSLADFPGRDALVKRVHEGRLSSGTNNERSGGPTGSVHTTLRRDGDSYLLNGEKYYSTGAMYSATFGATVTDEDGTILHVNVPTDREGVEIIDDFDGMGQRLSGSGTTRFTNVRVFEDEITGRERDTDENPWRSASGAQLYLTAVIAGIANRVFDDAVWYTRERSRPIRHSTAEASGDDPYVRLRVGEIASKAFAARATVLEAATQWQESWTVRGPGAYRAGAQASVFVAQAGVIAIEAALRNGELIFDLAGGSVTSLKYGFDRHWRNARQIANHNSRDWKAGKAGGFYLADEVPPVILF